MGHIKRNTKMKTPFPQLVYLFLNQLSKPMLSRFFMGWHHFAGKGGIVFVRC
jgi:hypothetical protein